MKEKNIIELLKSGDFTIIYWDNETPSLYKGKYTVDNISEDIIDNHEIKFNDYGLDGYCPTIVDLLVKALGGNSDSV